MLTLIILINLVSCAYVAGAFALQMTVHFPFLDENLSLVDVIGFIVTSIGVFISTRKKVSKY